MDKTKWIWLIIFLTIIVVLTILTILTQIIEHYEQQDPIILELKEIIKPLSSYPDYKETLENLKLFKGKKSYTINKERTYMCLYDEKGELYDKNFLTYVLLHEISHSLNKKDIGHTDEFHKTFEEVLRRSIDKGIYNPDKPLIQNYCVNGSGK